MWSVNVEPVEVIRWWQHPLTRAAFVLVMAGLGAIVTAIVTWVKFAHPLVKQDINKVPADALAKHTQDTDRHRERIERELALLKQGHAEIGEDVREIKADVVKLRDVQETHGRTLVGMGEKLVGMDGKMDAMLKSLRNGSAPARKSHLERAGDPAAE